MFEISAFYAVHGTVFVLRVEARINGKEVILTINLARLALKIYIKIKIIQNCKTEQWKLYNESETIYNR